jgi:CDP-6-deoxy-D-xylo-4-hexulose-3-dehydrase
MTKQQLWNQKKVFLTGHTGFKGAWLALWLTKLGAKVCGFSLPPLTHPGALYNACDIGSKISTSLYGDVRDLTALKRAIADFQPEVIFHLAAQAMVGVGFQDPVNTYSTNVMGTVNILEAARDQSSVKAILNVTTDKCYANKELKRGYTEEDQIGGADPYSGSKACSELVTSSYREAFFSSSSQTLIATARAGNVIGGGDFSEARLIPDIVRAISEGKILTLRDPAAIRPWQHTLEPLTGYLSLAEKLLLGDQRYAESWNFGPNESEHLPVSSVVKAFSKAFDTPCSWEAASKNYHETKVLFLDSSKAIERLGWRPKFKLEEALQFSASWYKEWHERPNTILDFTLQQIEAYESLSTPEETIERGDSDTRLREPVYEGVKRYYSAIHKSTKDAPFKPGDKISYAGRVFDEQEMLSLSDALLDFWLTAGRFSDKFEKEFAQKLGVRFSTLVNSGSSANLLAFTTLTSPLLKERQIKPGHEVITVAAGFPTTISPIIQNGCIPVFLDITVYDGTYNVDVSRLEEALSPKTRAVMLAHTLGNPFNLEVVTEFCKKHNLWLIEDNCDALGSRYKGQLTGTFGDLATSSFYPPHHLTMGEGGAVYSKSIHLKRLVESFRDWGRDCWCAAGKDNTCGIRFGQQLGELPFGYDHKYIYRHFGYNLKATDLQASIGCAQLLKLDGFVESRRSNWQQLYDGLKEFEDRLILPRPTPHSEPSWFGFLLSARPGSGIDRNQFVKFLEAKNIQTRMLFAGNILKHPLFDELRANESSYRVMGTLDNSDFVLSNTFWLGVYPGLKPGMIEYMIDSMREFLREA